MKELEIGHIYAHADEQIYAKSASSPQAMEDVMNCPAFELLFPKIAQVEDGTERRMTISYLKDVFLLLALVSADREKYISRHLQAEKVMLSLCFALITSITQGISHSNM